MIPSASPARAGFRTAIAGLALEPLLIFLLVAAQILNNGYAAVTPVLSLGEAATAAFLVFGACLLVSRRAYTNGAGVAILVLLTLFALGGVVGTAAGQLDGRALRYLVTLLMQWSAACLLVLYWRREWVGPALMAFIAVGVALAVLNSANAFVPGFSFLQVRESAARTFFGLRLIDRRLITVTDIYGQFGFFFVLGLFLAVDTVRIRPRGAVSRTAWVGGLLFLLAVGAISTQSRSIILASATAVLVYGMLIGSWALRSVLVGLVGIFLVVYGSWLMKGLIAVHAITAEGRLEAMRAALQLLPQHLLGMGQGGYRDWTGSAVVLHNTFLDAFMIGGILSGTAFAAIMLTPLVILWRHRRQGRLPVSGFLAGYAGGLIVLNLYNGLTEYQYFFIPAIALGMARSIRAAPMSGNDSRQ